MRRYLASTDFDARQEAVDLITRLSNPGTEIARLRTIVDVIHSLEEARDLGFVGIAHKWERTAYDGLFLYSHLGVLAAINVPGSGRAQTFDLTLLGVCLVEGEDEKRAVDEFLGRMSNRRATGTSHDWP